MRRKDREHDSGREVFESLVPYIIIVAVFAIAQIGPIKDGARRHDRRRSSGRASTS